MRSSPIAWVLAALAGTATVAGAEDAAPLQAGKYEVRVHLEFPHVGQTDGAARTHSICVTGGEAGTRGLAVLDDSNPLRTCPTSNVRRYGATLTFEIVCPGSDAAVGTARYAMWAGRFEAAIAVRMGGKNMTMVERQSGRRIGGCTPKLPRS